MKSLLSSKKGDARVYLGIVIFIFIFAFVFILSHALLTEISTAFDATGMMPAESMQVFQGVINALRIMDYVLILVMITLIIGVGITSYRVAVSPVFFILEFLAIAFYGFIAFFFNYIFQELVSNSFFTATKLYFSNSLIIATNLHWILLANFIVGVITFYAKKEKGQFLS